MALLGLNARKRLGCLLAKNKVHASIFADSEAMVKRGSSGIAGMGPSWVAREIALPPFPSPPVGGIHIEAMHVAQKKKRPADPFGSAGLC